MPPSPLKRVTDELATREEVRERMKELDRWHEEREHWRRIAEIRAAARQVGEFKALARGLEATCRYG
mgnify:CR=1 FL=1